MTLQFRKRIRQLEGSNSVITKPDFNHVHPDEIEKWREILTVATDSGDWSSYYSDLAVDAPAVYAAYRKAGYCE